MSETIIIIIKKEKKRKRKRKRKKQYAHISSLNDRVTNRNTCVLYLNRRRPLIKVLICVILDKWTEGEREREREKEKLMDVRALVTELLHTHTHTCASILWEAVHGPCHLNSLDPTSIPILTMYCTSIKGSHSNYFRSLLKIISIIHQLCVWTLWVRGQATYTHTHTHIPNAWLNNV